MSEKREQKPGTAAVGLDSTAAAVSDGITARDAEVPDATKHAPGTRLGDYVVESFIAEGGFGSVYRARHEHHGAVALKISHVAASKLSTERLALQQNELEALLQLRHPSLVRVLDHGTLDDGRMYLALELIEGESLHHYMERRGRVDVIEALGLVRRIAEGIAHCHDAKILHLDLTPKNVIVVDAYAPELKIVDFGVAAFAENWLDVERRPAAGTPLYMAPELVADEPQIGGHCDVYALGLILYELLTGRFPFNATSTWDLFLKKLRGDMLPVTAHVPEVPEAVAETVTALLQPDPAKRGFTAASLGQHLKQLYFEILRGGESDASASRPIRTQAPADAHVVPLVGRDDELGALLARAEGALHDGDNGWAVVISGDPGIGKSRLLAELTHRLRLGRFAAGYGRCRAHGNLISYAGWRECLGQLEQVVAKARGPHADACRAALLDLLADPAVSDLTVLVPELESMLAAADTTHETAPASPDVGSKRVSQAVMRLVTTIARYFPTAIILEDLHWADQGTMDILGALVANELPPGLLILGTARPEAELPLGRALDRLRLQPLDETRSAALLRALAGEIGPSVIAELTAAIPLLRMGNPLVDTQVILHLKREGLLQVGDDGKIVMSERFDRGYVPPTTVSSVLERRLQHIPAGARDVLGIASLIGRQFRVADLREVAAPELDQSAVDDAVTEAIELSLCHAGYIASGEIGFVHDVIREHLESTVPTARRPELHGRIARALRVRATPAATLAYHLDQAGDRAAAAAKYVEGGIDADRVHDLVGSSKNLRRALALFLELPRAPERDRDLARTVSELARVTCLLGKTHEPLEHLERVKQAMQSPPPPEDALVMLHSAYARVYYAQGNFDQAMDYSARSLAVHDPALAPYQCVPANMYGRALCASGHFGPSIDVLTRGCELARETHELVELSHSAGLLGTALAFVGRFDESAARIDEASRIAEQLNNPARKLGVCLYQTLHDEATCRWDDGVRVSARLLAQAEELSMSGLYLYLGTMMAGRHHFHVGELSRARHLLRNAINLSTIFSIKTCLSWAHAYLGDVYFVENRVEDAHRCYASALELAREGKGDGHGVPLALIGMAHSSANLGVDAAQVRAYADDAFTAFQAASNVTGLATALMRWTEACATRTDLGDVAPIEARLDQLLDQLHVSRCEFWPSAPISATSAERAMPAPDYWKQRTGTHSDVGEKIAALSDTHTATGSLLLNLSTVEGFIPGFVGRQP
jgi:serine/threonine protein kinase/tetratricopeptide (TPR) repeat protein